MTKRTKDLTVILTEEITRKIKEELERYTIGTDWSKRIVSEKTEKYWKETAEMAIAKKITHTVTGTYVLNKIILDTPVDYVGVFGLSDIVDRKLGLKTDNRYSFEIVSSSGNKPEIINAKQIDIEAKNNIGKYSIILRGSFITDFPGERHEIEPVVIKAMVNLINDVSTFSFKTAKEEYFDKAVNNGSVVLQHYDNFKEAIAALEKLNSFEYHVFSLETGYSNSKVTNTSNQQKTGEFVDNFYLQADIVPLLVPFQKAFESGDRFAFLLTGEAGYGKTSAFQAIAGKLSQMLNTNIPHLYINCSVMLNTTDWFGIMQAKDGNTFFEETEFTKFVRNGNCVIILDEFNRLSIEVANSLLPILDDRGETTVRNTLIKAGKSIMFGITLNEGIEYTGIGGMLDKAIKSRITGKVEVRPLPENIEIDVIKRYTPDLDIEDISKLVGIMNNLRDTLHNQRQEGNYFSADVSTRTTKQIAWWMNKGLDISNALDYALFNFLGEDERVIFTDNLKIKGVM